MENSSLALGHTVSTRESARPWRKLLTAVMVSVLSALVSVAACAEAATPAETVESLKAKSPTLRDKQRLRIGVREDVPFMFYVEGKDRRRSGFEIEIAKALAAALGFDEKRIDWVPVRTLPERISVLEQNRADIVVANFSINKDREELVNFAGPYQLVPQAVLVRVDREKPLETLSDLAAPGVRVCVPTGSTSEAALKKKGIKPKPVDTNKICMDGLRKGDYDAFSTDLPVLAGLQEHDYRATRQRAFELLEIAIADTDERIGAAVPNNDEPLRQLLRYFLNRWKEQGEGSPWLAAYDRTLGQLPLDPKYRSQPHVDGPPDLADYDSKAPTR